MSNRFNSNIERPYVLEGASVPGVPIPEEVKKLIPIIESKCREMGLDYYPIAVEFVSHDMMSVLASYGGFPVRIPHWTFGMNYEEYSRGYQYGQYRISEMVINSNPCVIYCMDSNTLVNNVNVIGHAIGHNDFFKNNAFFKGTNVNMVNKMADHSVRVKKYIERWGYETVTQFIDRCFSIQTLIEPKPAINQRRKVRDFEFSDKRTIFEPTFVQPSHDYMHGWLNSDEDRKKQMEEIRIKEKKEFYDINQINERDIMGFLKNNAPLKFWQQDIIAMIYEESQYFYPQRITKMINEGWASFVDEYLMAREGMCALGQETSSSGIFEYSEHKAAVLRGGVKNPYKLGMMLFKDIEDRWNKGKFGEEWEKCTDLDKREKWDQKLGLGLKKVFEVRETHNDFMLINDFFTEEFCRKNKMFTTRTLKNGEVRLYNRDFQEIKEQLKNKYLRGGLPDIRLIDSNHLGKGYLLLEHKFDGEPLYKEFALPTIANLAMIWSNNVVLTTKTRSGTKIVYEANQYGDTKEYREKEYVEQNI